MPAHRSLVPALLLVAATIVPTRPAQAQVQPPGTPIPQEIDCEELFDSEDGILFGPGGTGGASPCTFPDRAPCDDRGLCEAVTAIDPNDKIGSQGATPARFVSGQEPFRYVINFENLPAATAPAQEVVITDQLDTAGLDPGTLSLGPIVFGDTVVVPPPGLGAFTEDVDLRPAQNIIARVTAGLDVTTGLLTWRLVALDPATGQLPEDPRVGLLPPNTDPPAGQGSVLFTIAPSASAGTGRRICNRARIVFDLNAPIETPEFCNTIDRTRPASEVLPLAATQSSPEFVVQWAGTDAGAGIRDFTVFVAENGGPFTPLVVDTPRTSTTFRGTPGATYAFFSLARDLAGNLEEAPAGADAVTTVRSNQPPVADAGPDRTVRVSSLVTLDGSGSVDPDRGPGPLAFAWTQTAGPAVGLKGAATARPTFTPGRPGTYVFSLTVHDGALASGPDGVTIVVPRLGDVDADGDVDGHDVRLILAARKSPASGPNDLRDLNGDGWIDVRDVWIAIRHWTGHKAHEDPRTVVKRPHGR